MLLGVILLGCMILFFNPSQRSLQSRIGHFLFIILIYSASTLLIWRAFHLSLDSWVSLTLPWPLLSKQVFLSIVVCLFTAIYSYIISTFSKRRQVSWSIQNILVSVFCLIVMFGGFLLMYSSNWAINYFGNIKFDQIMFTLSQPLSGTNTTQLKDYAEGPLLTTIVSVLWTVAISYMSLLFIRNQQKWRRTFPVKLAAFLWTMVFVLSSGVVSASLLGYQDIKAYFFESTKLYDQHYVDPRTVAITFPETKRNLIYIFLESMESSYASTDVGGIEKENLIPNLTNEALNEGINFSNRENLGGMISIPGANQTISAMFAQTSGLPLRTSGSIDENNYRSTQEDFMPGAYTLGDMLEEQGYNQMLFIGSQASFGGRDKYFKQHGNYNIRDYYWFKKEGIIPDDYYVWWGVEDEKIFPYAKESLTEMAQSGQPFNFTMLTTNTHFEDGFQSAATPYKFKDKYSNVIYYSDYLVEDLLQWIKAQDFYANTTVIVTGDHPTMDKDFFKDIDPNYQRTVYNVILNAPTQLQGSNKNRQFNSTDLFPTTLAALGVQLGSDRLGIGTNLFSQTPTLMETIGTDAYIQEVAKKSDFYNKTFIQTDP